MADTPRPADLPEGIFSILDTDLYKLTMQCCVLKYFPDVQVTYSFTNRTPDMKFSRASVKWLWAQIEKLENVALTQDELAYLRSTCKYLSETYLDFLSGFRQRPREQIHLTFKADKDTGSEDDLGAIELYTTGTWLETILYEIPLLALISETYFKFMDREWSYMHQVERARDKGIKLFKEGCIVSEFGTRRRRDYHTHDLVLQGLRQAADDGVHNGWPGKLAGTSNVHFAMKHGIPPIGTVAHEWFMGVAAITNDYENANELAMKYWIGTFGEGVLGIALTDTFGTESFVKAFAKPISDIPGDSAAASGAAGAVGRASRTYAEVFTGTRQDSGDPETFIEFMAEFYKQQGITERKAMVFSDSLNIEKCLQYKKAAEAAGFAPSFGIGTFLTNDFVNIKTGRKSVPLNIVIKLASCNGRQAVKISDNIGKNTGDKATVEEVKQRLGYREKEWKEGDETRRWN
ncbi:nicotinate phosphoribosyltransferase [Verruconis gallopava]|uniref:nicotinate phosphoribosyltransferase n=1 Tax=Verruconis gallopava TaxID=253628 RepID=A0A0D2AJU3_9PEZI|nr:nicotinate phosphoribosyltransferase [Verruconis gallopava]KIW07133.1 nicotinate phosphoribosyltransferase [Verruconis gallopava]